MLKHIKISFAKGEPLPENYPLDLDWIGQNRLTLYEQYGNCVLLVYHEAVIGKGNSLDEAVDDAEKLLSGDTGTITPVVKYLSNPYRISGFLRQKRD